MVKRSCSGVSGGALGWFKGGREQVAGGEAPVGPPFVGDGEHLLLGGEVVELIGGLDRFAQREVTRQHDVFSAGAR